MSGLCSWLPDYNSSFVWFWKFALNLDKEIIRLIISYLRASEPFIEPLFDQQHLC